MSERLSLSPLTVEPKAGESIVLAGPWCLNGHITELFRESGTGFQVLEPRVLSRQEFVSEARCCKELYNKYVQILAKELNRLHQTSYSERYWSTLLNRFLYPLIVSVMDKYYLLERIAVRHPGLVADIVDYRVRWMNPHTIPGFGGSRIVHLLLFSVLVARTGIIPYRLVRDDTVRQALAEMGDGKKDLKSKQTVKVSVWRNLIRFGKNRMKWLSRVRRALRGELPLWAFRYVTSPVLALGDQYLEPAVLKDLLSKAGGGPYYCNPREWDMRRLSPYDENSRSSLRFPLEESSLEVALQECLRVLLPTIFLENFAIARRKVRRILPRRRIVILNSQNASGRELLDFFVAHSVEEYGSHHLMVCHGGCYGAMEVSVQDEIWSEISDSYALWSVPKSYGPACEFLKLPSLRFHKWRGFGRSKPSGEDILMCLTGYYPQRYAYNSIFPYTIDDTYDEWQLRFLSALSEKNSKLLVIRDYHRSSDISQGNLRAWADRHGIRVSAQQSMMEALRESKIAIQTVPQTTYLETITADHPTICYWNPDANMIRGDLQRFYDQLISVGVLHMSPESAARKLNEVADDPMTWWHSSDVRDALRAFRENVCWTSPDALDRWAGFVARKIGR